MQLFDKNWDCRAVQRRVLCRSRRELFNAYLLAKFGFDTAENEFLRIVRFTSQPASLEWTLPSALLTFSHPQMSEYKYHVSGPLFPGQLCRLLVRLRKTLFQDEWQQTRNAREITRPLLRKKTTTRIWRPNKRGTTGVDEISIFSTCAKK